MPVPSSVDDFLAILRESGLVEPERFQTQLDQVRSAASRPDKPKELAAALVKQGILTYFQADQLLRGKRRGFIVGKYKLLEQLGSGGMGVVYLCEHKFMRRRVAVKFLPLALAEDPWFLEYFYREAQAVAAVDHPNIVHAYDIDHEGKLHFIVMEYVDGASLQEIIDKHGPMTPLRAAHYIKQAALGLQHAFEVGLIHRDIKPGNLLLDRNGIVKILDMGLVRFFRENEKKKAKAEKRMVGTTDYLAPEQVVDSDEVDIRADIYGLGATFYFLLTGKTPFEDQSIAHQKLISHLARSPKPIRDFRTDVREELEAIVYVMMAKNPWDRFSTPAMVADALEPWTKQPIAPPALAEMPRLCLAARRNGQLDEAAKPPKSGVTTGSWVVRRGEARANVDSGLLSDPSRQEAGQAQTPPPSEQPTQSGKPSSGPVSPRPSAPASRAPSDNSTVSVDPDAVGRSLPSSSFYEACLRSDSVAAPADPEAPT